MCDFVINLFLVANSTSCSNLRTTFNDTQNPSVSPSTFGNDVDTICTSDCLPNLQTAIQTVQADCTNTVDLDLVAVEIAVVVQYFKLFCYTDSSSPYPGNYCLPVVRDTLMALQNSNVTAAPNATFLASVCNPCFAKFIKFVAVISGLNGGDGAEIYYSFALFCLTDKVIGSPTEVRYCVLEFDLWNSNSTDFNDKVTHLCETRCLDRIIWLMIAASGDNLLVEFIALELGAVFRFLCQRNDNGTLCLPQVSELFDSAETNPCQALGSSNCTAGCKTFLTSHSQSMGCCFGTAMDFVALQTNESGFALRLFVSTTCSLPLADFPVGCDLRDEIGILIITLTIAGIADDYYIAHKVAIEIALLEDLAIHLGLDPSTGNVTNSTTSSKRDTNGNTYFTATLQCDDQTACSQTSVDPTTMTLINTAQNIPASGQTSISEGVDVTDATTTYSTPKPMVTNDSKTLTFGVFLLFISLLLAFA